MKMSNGYLKYAHPCPEDKAVFSSLSQTHSFCADGVYIVTCDPLITCDPINL